MTSGFAQGQMMILPESSRSLLRVAATLYTSLEGEELPTAAKAAASPPRKKTLGGVECHTQLDNLEFHQEMGT